MSTMIPYGNISKLVAAQVVASLAQVGANTTGERNLSVPGVKLSTDVVVNVSMPNPQTGLGIVGSRVVSDDVVGVTFMNNTASPITPTPSQVYTAVIARVDATQANFS